MKCTEIHDNKIRNALSAAGIVATATEVETIKNGITCTGYKIDNGSGISPVVYYSQEGTAEEFVERVLQIAKQPVPDFDLENLISRDRLLSDTYLCLQKKGDEPLLKREYLDLEQYVRLNVPVGTCNEIGSIKVNDQILQNAGISEAQLFEAAECNSRKLVSFESMSSVLGISEEIGEVPFFVGTYKNDDGRLMGHGAAVLSLPKELHSFCESHGYKRVFCLPSSTEEILILPADDSDPAELAALVNEVNSSEGVVDKVLQLNPVVYMFDDETGMVTIAASYEGRC